MKSYHDTKSPTRAIRVPEAIHREVKITAARAGITISQLADEALEAELRRRQPPQPKARPPQP